MSGLYVQRLRGVQAELNAARAALVYVERHWQRHAISGEIDRLRPRDFAQAALNVEVTYFTRLYAEFEGILKDHLATNHPRVAVPSKPRVDWLISRVVQAEGMAVELLLRRKMDAVRDFRNSIAHRSRRTVPRLPFDDALSTLNTFLARLPDPLT